MEKSRKILLIISGIFNILIGTFCAFISLVCLVFKNVLKTVLDTSFDIVQNFIDELVESDASYAYLQETSKQEMINFFMDYMKKGALIVLAIALIWLAFGILDLVILKDVPFFRANKKGLLITFVIFTWLLLWFNINNILVTIALCMKNKKKNVEMITSSV